MQAINTTILVASLAALTGCASWDKSPICPPSHGWLPWPDDRCAAPKDMAADASKDMADRLAALEKERNRLANELAAAQRQNSALSSRVSDLERQLAGRDREIAALRSGAGDSAKLAADLAASRQRNADLERRIEDLEKQLADCEARLAGLRGQLDQSKDSLAKAEKDLLKALQPE